MAVIFNGWLGYGTGVTAGVLAEPADPAYVRRPLILGDLDNGVVSDCGSGTIGPASAPWGAVGFAGIYDSQSGGNLLLWMPLRVPVTVAIGGTIATNGGTIRLLFPELRTVNSSKTWPPGVVVATTRDGLPVSSGVALQFAGGTLSAQPMSFGTTIVMASLPQAQPATGSGQLWNNGGVISIA